MVNNSSITSQFISRAQWIFGAELTIRVFKLISGLLIIRLLTPEDFGLYSILFASATIFSFIYDPGLTTLILKNFSTYKRYTRLFYKFLRIKLLFLLIGIVCFYIAYFYNIAPGSSIIDAIGMLAMIILNELIVFFFTILRARNITQSEVLYRIFHGALTVIFLSILFFYDATIIQVLLAQILPFILIFPFLFYQTQNKLLGSENPLNKNINLAIAIRIKNIAVFQMVAIIWSSCELLIAAQFFSSSQLGFYGAMLRLFLLALLPSAVIATTLLPQLGAIKKRAKFSIVEIWNSLGKFSFICLILIVIFMNIQSDNIISVVIGDKYIEAQPILISLTWRIIPASFLAITTSILMAYGNFKSLTRIYGSLLILIFIALYLISNNIELMKLVNLFTAVTSIGALICILKVLNLSKFEKFQILFKLKDIFVMALSILFLILTNSYIQNPFVSLMLSVFIVFLTTLHFSRPYIKHKSI